MDVNNVQYDMLTHRKKGESRQLHLRLGQKTNALPLRQQLSQEIVPPTIPMPSEFQIVASFPPDTVMRPTDDDAETNEAAIIDISNPTNRI